MSSDNSNNDSSSKGKYRIGSPSVVIASMGYDWRDLKMLGHRFKQIQGVVDGEYTLDELFKMKPEDKPAG